MDIEKLELAWRRRGFSFGVWSDPPGRCWEGYEHETDELFMLLSGEVELEVDGQARRAKPGEEILIPAGAVHSVRNRGRTGSRWLYGYASISAEPQAAPKALE